MTTELLVVRAHAFTIDTDAGITTLTVAGTAVITALLGVDTLATTGGLTSETFTGTSLAVLVCGAGMSARTTVVAVGKDGDALVGPRATNATSLALDAHASTIDTRGESGTLETADTTVVAVGQQVGVAATALAGAARLTGTATVVASTAVVRVISQTDTHATTAGMAGGARLATDTTILGIALEILATSGAHGCLLSTTTVTLDASLASIASVTTGSAVTGISEEVLA
jgi:hypothetical protein